MIIAECFTKSYLEKIKSEFPVVDPTIFEKTIYAFELLVSLVEENLDFIFKGGTSLLLLIPQPKRLSIDIDISVNISKEKLENKLEQIKKKGKFFDWVEDPRTENNIPKKHYKLFFNSVINPGTKSYILLDTLFENNPYPKIFRKEINTDLVLLDSKVKINLPTINSIIGDKLTAFAPNTTGIQFGIDKEMQINKQLFDIGELFNFADDIDEIRESFNNFVRIQSQYLNCNFSIDEVLNDIYKISFLISQINLKGGVSNEITELFLKGMKALRSHLLRGVYNLEETKIYSSRVAFLVSSLKSDINFNQHKHYEILRINNNSLTGEFKVLERLRKILPEAYYYWQTIHNEIKE